MADIVRFEIGVSRTLKLRNAAGREKEGNYGVQFMHALMPEGLVFLEPAVERQLQALGVEDGDEVAITKCGKGKPWIVRRLSGLDSAIAPAATDVAPAIERAPAPVTTNNTPQPNTINRATPSAGAKLTAGALIAAIDATMLATQYAASKGLTVAFNEEDLRCIASTLLIQYWRNGAIPQQTAAPAKVNGGTTWEQ